MTLANLSVHSSKLMHLNHSTKLKHVNDKECDCTLCLCSQDAAHLVLVIPRTLPKALVLLQAFVGDRRLLCKLRSAAAN